MGFGTTRAQRSTGDFDFPLTTAFREINDIAQDQYGALWLVGTQPLSYYDGYTLRTVGHVGRWIPNHLTGGRHGVLCTSCVGEDLSLFFIDRNTTAELQVPAEPDGSPARVSRVIEASNGLFWVGTDGGSVLVLNPRDCLFKTCTKASLDHVRALCEDRKGDVWVGTSRGLFLIQTAEVVARTQPDLPVQRIHDGDVAGAACGKDGRLWVCLSDRRFGWIDPATHRLTFCSRMPGEGSLGQIESTSVDSAGGIWIAAGGSGLLRWDPTEGLWEEHLVSRDPHFPTNGESVHATLVDRTGILWAVGSTFRGIARYVPEKRVFHSLKVTEDASLGLAGSVVLAAKVDHEGTLWVGTRGGGIQYRPRGSSGFRSLRHDPADLRTLSSNFVTCMCERRNGDLWIGTYDGINVLDRKALTFTHIRFGSGTRGANTITALLEDSRGKIWIGHFGGADEYDPQTGEFRPLIRWPSESVLREGTVSFFLEDHRRDLWVATVGRGVMRLNLQQGDTVWYREPSVNTVHTLCEDPEGRIWFGTLDGLTEYDDSTHRFISHQVFMVESGNPSMGTRPLVPTEVTSGIIPDGRGNLWLSTKAGGLVRFEVATGRQRAFTSAEGVVVRSGYRNAFFRAADGSIYCGGDGGLTWFNPDQVRDSGVPPNIRLSRLTVFDRPLALGVHTVPELRFEPDENTLTFEFVALDYGSPDRNQFEYMLEGASQRWIRTELSRSVTFANLSAGKYVLRVRGAGREGLWSTEDCVIRFTVLPPWWRTTWAYAGYVLGLAGFLFVGYRLRVRQIRMRHQIEMEHFKAEHLTEVDRLKSRFFANISHEFRTPLTLILGPIERIRTRHDDTETHHDLGLMQRNARRLLQLINQLLDLSKIDAGEMKLRAVPGDVVPFVKGIAYSFESSAGVRGISLDVSVPDEPIEVFYDRDKLETILTNLLSNALKFTPKAGVVHCTVTRGLMGPRDDPTDAVTITVSDSGIGIPEDELDKVFDRFHQVDASQTRDYEGSGIGLALIKELVELHRGTVQVASQVGKGTTFTVRLPLGRNHLRDEEIAERSVADDLSIREEQVAVDHAETPKPEEEAEVPQGDGERPIVLIVEDNADVRAYIREYLVSSYHVIEARDGEEGIFKAQETIPDLIISDVMMPKKDGYEMCKSLKRDERTSHIPVILLTAKAGSENKIEGLGLGADDYLIKPFVPGELVTRVRNLIELRASLRSKYAKGSELKPGEVSVTSLDDAFLKRLMEVVEKNIGRPDFGVDELAREACLSRIQLYRKLRALTNMSPAEFVKRMRLLRARELLEKNSGSVAEIADSVGFFNPSHFARAFKAHFGVLPGDVRRGHANVS